MISSRIISFFFFLAAFGLFACASPIASTEVAERTTSDLTARGGGWGTHPPCGCSQDVVDVLIDLKVALAVKVGLLTGLGDVAAIIADIIVIINAKVAILAGLSISLSAIVAADLTIIAQLLVDIIVSITVGLAKYSILITLTLWLNIDLCLAGLVNVVVGLVGGILGGLVGIIGGLLSGAHLSVFICLHLTLTLAACGL